MQSKMRMMPSQRSLLGASVVLLLTACATDPSTCDPKDPGFISGLSAMASGCYEQRVMAKQNEAAAGQALTSQLHTENQSLVQQKKLTAAQKSQAQSKVSAMQARNAELERKLRSMNTTTGGTQEEKARLEQQLQQAKADTARLKQQIEANAITQKELNQQTREYEESASELAASLVVQ